MRTDPQIFNIQAPRRAVNLSLNEDLVQRARGLSGNLSAKVEELLAEYLKAEHAKRIEDEQALERTIDFLNDMREQYGTLSEEIGQI